MRKQSGTITCSYAIPKQDGERIAKSMDLGSAFWIFVFSNALL